MREWISQFKICQQLLRQLHVVKRTGLTWLGFPHVIMNRVHRCSPCPVWSHLSSELQSSAQWCRSLVLWSPTAASALPASASRSPSSCFQFPSAGHETVRHNTTCIRFSSLHLLHYFNTQLGGCPQSSTNKLQFVQNAAASILTRPRKYDHIVPLLSSLHWPPIEFSIDYKILFLWFNRPYITLQSIMFFKGIVKWKAVCLYQIKSILMAF